MPTAFAFSSSPDTTYSPCAKSHDSLPDLTWGQVPRRIHYDSHFSGVISMCKLSTSDAPARPQESKIENNSGIQNAARNAYQQTDHATAAKGKADDFQRSDVQFNQLWHHSSDTAAGVIASDGHKPMATSEAPGGTSRNATNDSGNQSNLSKDFSRDIEKFSDDLASSIGAITHMSKDAQDKLSHDLSANLSKLMDDLAGHACQGGEQQNHPGTRPTDGANSPSPGGVPADGPSHTKPGDPPISHPPTPAPSDSGSTPVPSDSGSTPKPAGRSDSPDPLFQKYGLSIPEAALKPGPGKAYYVDASAANNGNGGQNSPFKTIQAAADAAKAGDTVYVKPGVYKENVLVRASGTADKPIKFISTEQGAAEIQGSSNKWMFTANGDHVSVIGFDVNGKDAARGGILMNGAHDSVIGNDVHDMKSFDDGNGGAAIDFGNYLDKNGKIIEGSLAYGNIVHDNGDLNGGSNRASHGIYLSNIGTIANNVVFNNEAFGLHMWHADTNDLIENNLVFNNGKSGLVFGGDDGPFNGARGPSDMIIRDNIFVDNHRMGLEGAATLGKNNKVYNNVITGGVRFSDPSSTVVTGTLTDRTLAAQHHIGHAFIDPNLVFE